MSERIITLCYRKIIAVSATKPWDKLVFEESYAELRMQAQYYNQEQKYRTFGQLLHQVPGADKLHFLVSGAVVGYVQQLNGQVPDIVNNLGKHFLKFSRFQFEIINSDLFDKAKHQVAVNFFSEPLVWHDTLAPYLLVSEPQTTANSPILTEMFQLQPYLSIYSITPAPAS